MRLDMIDLFCEDVLATLQAFNTPRFSTQLIGAHHGPTLTIVQLLHIGIAHDALGRVSGTTPTFD
jgi:hypothetical protein